MAHEPRGRHRAAVRGNGRRRSRGFRSRRPADVVLTNCKRAGEVVVGSAIQEPACFLLADAAPLLEEEVHAVAEALVADVTHPVLLHRPRSGPGLTAYD